MGTDVVDWFTIWRPQNCLQRFFLNFSFERKNEVNVDKARNLIDGHAKKEGNFLVVSFIRQMQTDDSLYDVDIG